VQDKKQLLWSRDQFGSGLKFELNTTEPVKIRVSRDIGSVFLHIGLERNYPNNTIANIIDFNPALILGEKYVDIRAVADFVLELLSKIYESFNYEIITLELTDAFIDLFELWEKLSEVCKTLSKEDDQEICRRLCEQFGTLSDSDNSDVHNSDTVAHSLDAFGFATKPTTVITSDDSFQDAIMKMSKGVPDALVALTQLSIHPEIVDPAVPFTEILALDTLGVYGSELYDLLIYCCENSIKNYRLVSLNHSYGKLSTSTIKKFIKESKSFFRERYSEGMENFEDWSGFDCYPECEDAPFDPDKQYCLTWPDIWSDATDDDVVDSYSLSQQPEDGTALNENSEYANKTVRDIVSNVFSNLFSN